MSRRSKSSGAWLARQRRDPYVGRAVSRAYFKLEQLDARFRLTGSARTVLELGAAPGGWTEYLAPRCRLVVACDLAPLGVAPPGVRPLVGDARDASVHESILAAVGNGKARPFDVVLSDMSPNMSGNRLRDQAASLDLVDCAVDLAERWLEDGGRLVAKMFQGPDFEAAVADIRQRLGGVTLAKPRASREGSREVYAIAGNGVE